MKITEDEHQKIIDWMQSEGLSHSSAAEIIGVSTITLWQWTAKKNGWSPRMKKMALETINKTPMNIYNNHDAKHWHDVATLHRRQLNSILSATDSLIDTLERAGAISADVYDPAETLRDITVMLQSGELRIEAVEVPE
jgi:hypothetical protein